MKLVEKKYLLPFVVITVLFALWGFANDITNPMVAAFQTLMELPAAKASLIQFAFVLKRLLSRFFIMAFNPFPRHSTITPRKAQWLSRAS